MTDQVLARHWRPRRFDQVVGQVHVVRSLSRAAVSQSPKHAYLLTGTRGVGKTSLARIFAKALRCEHRDEQGNPCLKCTNCSQILDGSSLDYTELDGASHNGVDDIRAVIDQVRYVPTSGRFRLIVIDEVHMLSTSAFNALLKTLEEPPSHVVFVLATTEPHKLLDTVVSRCQRLDLLPHTTAQISEHLRFIEKESDWSFEGPTVSERVAVLARGSLRDALTLLDQVLGMAQSQVISEQDLHLACSIPPMEDLEGLLDTIAACDAPAIVEQTQHVFRSGVDVRRALELLLDQTYERVALHPGKGIWTELYRSLSQDLTWALNSFDVGKTLTVLLVRHVDMPVDAPVQEKKNLKTAVSTPRVTSSDALVPELPEGILAPGADIAPEAGPEVVAPAPVPPTNEQASPAALIEQPPVQGTPPLEMANDLPIQGPPAEDPAPPSKSAILEARPLSENEDWNRFMDMVGEKDVALQNILRHGNIEGREPIGVGSRVVVNFGVDAKVFYDSAKERESEIRQCLHQFAGGDVAMELRSLGHASGEQGHFSQAHIEQNRAEQIKEEKRKELLEGPVIQKASQLFRAKVDKIILQEQP